MRRRAEEDEASPYLFCEKCQQMFERMLIQECPFCFKDFCRNCAVRSGNMAYCGKACAEAWFFAEADDDDEDDMTRD
jgi:hypothetical protein